LVRRCGNTRGTVTVVPTGYLDVDPPPVSVTLPRGSTAWLSENFQAVYRAADSTTAGGTVAAR
jgi:hypothetical protein